MKLSRDELGLAGASFLVLFLELAWIRYLPAQVKYFSYFTNFVLLAAFLGSGIGLLAARRARALAPLWPLAIVLLTAATFALRNVVIANPGGEWLWGLYGQPSPRAIQMGLVPTVLVLFALLALAFVPLGARLGELFGRFPALKAYGLDIAGALSGIAAFTILSRAGAGPLVWFTVAFGVAAVVLTGRWVRVTTVAASLVALVLIAGEREPSERWSPYYRITVQPGDSGVIDVVSVNGSMHQWIVNFGATDHEMVQRVRQDYVFPYRYTTSLDTVLVVGSGTGNDIAILLALGAKYIDAVEIDQEIARLGRTRNPVQPYADPRVHLHVDDARAFLRKTRRHYNVIVFGTLDSQALLSGMTSLRLDNYVYTLEAMQDAHARLAPDGRIITYHMSASPFIAARIHQVLWLAFRAPPLVVYYNPHRLFNYAFVGGVPGTSASDLRATPWLVVETRTPTDNWPYLYLDQPRLPGHYAGALAGVLLLAALGVAVSMGRGLGMFDAPMFFLGAGFLLVETKSVTEMALLFGSTWVVNVAVFAAILSVVLLGTWRVARGGARDTTRIFVWLLVALGIGAVVPVRAFAGLPVGLNLVLPALLAALPVFLAALVFPRFLATRQDPARALGWNVLGAIVGGVVEYASMIWGIKALYGLAALAYGAAWLTSRRDAAR